MGEIRLVQHLQILEITGLATVFYTFAVLHWVRSHLP